MIQYKGQLKGKAKLQELLPSASKKSIFLIVNFKLKSDLFLMILKWTHYAAKASIIWKAREL